MLMEQQEVVFFFFSSAFGLWKQPLSSPVSFSFTSSRLYRGIKSEIICFKAYSMWVGHPLGLICVFSRLKGKTGAPLRRTGKVRHSCPLAILCVTVGKSVEWIQLLLSDQWAQSFKHWYFKSLISYYLRYFWQWLTACYAVYQVNQESDFKVTI